MVEDSAPMPKVLVFTIYCYLLLVNFLCLYLVFQIWPDKVSVGEGGGLFIKTRLLHFGEVWLAIERAYIAIALVCGALGGTLSALHSFASDVGNRRLVTSWGLWFIHYPFVGMTLALILYFALRGGVLQTGQGVDVTALNPYGIAGLSALIGMFSSVIIEKLKERARETFKTEKVFPRNF